MVRVRCMPTDISVSRFGHAIAGNLWWPDGDARQGACSFSALYWPRKASFGGPSMTSAQGHVNFFLSVLRFSMGKDGQLLVARLQRVPHGVFVLCIGLAKGGKPLMARVRRNPGVMFVLA